MKFNKETLKEIIYDDHEDFDVIQKEIVDTTRWSTVEEAIFLDKTTNKYYATTYSYGATECQDESPYDCGPDKIEVDEVEPKEATVIKYVPIKKEN